MRHTRPDSLGIQVLPMKTLVASISDMPRVSNCPTYSLLTALIPSAASAPTLGAFVVMAIATALRKASLPPGPSLDAQYRNLAIAGLASSRGMPPHAVEIFAIHTSGSLANSFTSSRSRMLNPVLTLGQRRHSAKLWRTSPSISSWIQGSGFRVGI
eukprot:CAMPEP_0172041824 /NCGR_PEP_ID=MMETSP1041-20130122/25315_1 /TAXON_ID=464988 /ORGANISM="Hemiselmis andersenii, Strain CCMP439" /LENGTH=155 /DNA_ID=CAMNT_0012699969 /DNA_START=248 /DNA_END=715 /DNA_ORIENTATION=-